MIVLRERVRRLLRVNIEEFKPGDEVVQRGRHRLHQVGIVQDADGYTPLIHVCWGSSRHASGHYAFELKRFQ